MAKKSPFIDPLTGLDQEPSGKELISPEALMFSSDLTSGGPQDSLVILP